MADKSHWHVSRHSEDDDIYSTEGFVEALSYAAYELDKLAEFEHEIITTYGDSELFQEAYEAFKCSMQYANLSANAENIYKQYRANHPSKRAAAYQGEDWQEKLELAADRIQHEINSGSPMKIYECTMTECAPVE
jgi:hypothetical protein